MDRVMVREVECWREGEVASEEEEKEEMASTAWRMASGGRMLTSFSRRTKRREDRARRACFRSLGRRYGEISWKASDQVGLVAASVWPRLLVLEGAAVSVDSSSGAVAVGDWMFGLASEEELSWCEGIPFSSSGTGVAVDLLVTMSGVLSLAAGIMVGGDIL